MDIMEILIRGWPIILGLITLIIVLAKLDLRVAVLEDKMKSAWELINRMREK